VTYYYFLFGERLIGLHQESRKTIKEKERRKKDPCWWQRYPHLRKETPKWRKYSLN